MPVANEDLAAFRGSNLRCELHFAMASKSMYGFDSVDSYAIMNRLRKRILDQIRETVTKENITRIHMVLASRGYEKDVSRKKPDFIGLFRCPKAVFRSFKIVDVKSAFSH